MNLVKILNGKETSEFGPTRIAKHIQLVNTQYFLSVQASRAHYCHPRKTLAYAEYETFEVMAELPQRFIPNEWENYNCGGVYGWVPKEEIEKLLSRLSESYELE